ncbi:PEP-CTERM sorting domain-containing protein [Colwellia sp. 4_MG-2023]|jgi:hypothetical protein|uniref:PEP-CTERM sorting domain-containing protein n=1 Tax=unclassified Colwellia TaxID=196834 RepID=UPI0026E23CFE|nr:MULTISPECIES: PEP-CTERM sorting domain-containing protein [unclassified Colwellia]MDO6508809.1 PEP-CTERM sorting domain-containing protein [Colwellia sp. 5_MG-2023]MDO6557488.1 PEP-CTERM sorting domain-containing protein [Colwellia sp. 4_MG-2023]
MKKFIITIATAFVLATSINVQAGLIDIELSNNDVALGNTLNVKLWGSSFTEFDTLFVDLEFDISLYSFQPATVQSELPLFDGLWGLEVTEQFFGANLTFYGETSFTDQNIDGDDQFLLASFDLLAIAEGNSDFQIDTLYGPLVALGLGDSQLIDVGPSVNAVSTSVPEPSSFAIFMLSALMLVRRKKQ